MVDNAVVSHNSVNELYYLEEVDSTNTWAKANLDKFGPVGAVYTTSQTAGRGRRGHTWINASGQALYYTVVLKLSWLSPKACRCLPAWPWRMRWNSGTASSARSNGPTTCC